MPVPRPSSAKARHARNVQLHGAHSPEAIETGRDLMAANIGAAIDRALSSSAAPLKREHATELAARLKAASR